MSMYPCKLEKEIKLYLEKSVGGKSIYLHMREFRKSTVPLNDVWNKEQGNANKDLLCEFTRQYTALECTNTVVLENLISANLSGRY